MDTSPAEKIIVFESYDTVMDANLAKTKLDAYGIPCFLTEENFTTWYPFRNNIFPGVRLHIFEKDINEVRGILEQQHTENFIKCPHCGSVQWEQDESAWKRIYSSAVMLIGMFLPIDTKDYHCKNCGKDFD
jgi:DNA-directed RNA polymerase subunit RPC12/RpoP